jgi:methylglutaconyl-CoA hydratase
MKYRTLFVDIKHSIGIVWMNRPKLHNALNETMISEMTTAMRTLSDDPAIRAVVLAGAGESFCAGADLKRMRRLAGYNVEQIHADAMNFATLLHTINTLKKPTIARVHGPGFADGVGLVAACDMAVAAYDTEFCLSEVRLGLIPTASGPYVIRAMGERAARRYLLSAERFTAAEAYRIGLVSDIAPLVELDARINELLGQLIQGEPCAQALSKEWILAAEGPSTISNLINEDARRIAAALTSKGSREGIRSFLEKRKPAWLGQTEKTAAKKTAALKTKGKK